MKPTAADIVSSVLDAAADYDIGACDRLLAGAAAELDTRVFIEEVVSPLLREAGDRWHRGDLAVVQEHMISGVVRRQLYYALDRHLASATGPRVLFTTLSGERHEMGGLMGAVLAASRGFRCVYLGPDLPPEEICRFCRNQSVDAVALGIVTQPAVIDAPAQLAELRRGLSPAIRIWVAGQATTVLARDRLPEGVSIIPDLASYLDRLAALEGRQAP